MEKLAQENLSQENLIIKVVLIIVLLLILFLSLRNQPFTKVVPQTVDQNGQMTAQDQEVARQVIARVGALIQLPEGEPQIAVVKDPQILAQNQAFFANAQVGDVLLVYPTTAILYRPQVNKIINIGPVQTGSGQAGTVQPEVSQEEAPTSFTLEVRNASGKNGYAAQWVTLANLPETFTVTTTSTAKNAPVTKTTLFVQNPAITPDSIKANFPDVEIQSGQVPAGQAASTADLVLYLK
jgi:hypothetical protein